MSSDEHPVVTTTHGTVRGQSAGGGIVAFKGIPYAAPPVGADRLEAPRPPQAWAGIRDGSSFGATLPQAGYQGPIADLLPNHIIDGDDSLNLNVWTPGLDQQRPVMVFIHGGAFVSGSGSVPGYDGHTFARDGVVLVTLNYRLGFDGFGWVEGGTQNRGLLDQIHALRWVQQNIAAFGGDPGQVTVFGESAGAMSIGCLLAMPQARGLFHRAILQSGAASNVLSAAAARKTARKLARILGISPTRENFATLESSELLTAQAALRAGPEWRRRLLPEVVGALASSTMHFQPVIDGTVLPESPIEAIKAGSADQVEIVVGSNSEESRLYLVPTGMIDRVTGPVLWAVAAAMSRNPRHTVRTLRQGRRGATYGELLDALLTHRLYRKPARDLVTIHPRAWLYEFSWRSPAYDGRLGACHGLDLAFVFDLLDHPSYRGLTGGQAPQDLADQVHGSWVGFAVSGEPGWPVAGGTPQAERLGPDGPWVDPMATDARIRWRGHP